MLKLISFSLGLKLLHFDINNPFFQRSMTPQTLEIRGQATFKEDKQLFQLACPPGK